MKKKIIILIIIIISLITIDTMQSYLLNNSPLIHIRKKLDNENYVDKGILINTYKCNNEINSYFKTKKHTCNKEQKESNTKEEINMEIDKIYIKINNNIISATLEKNSSSKALVEKLKQEDITINMHDYANFEKVGPLGFSLPTNDTKITTQIGDIILYQGNQVTIYYDTNTWEFTKLGHVDNEYIKDLKSILGKGNVTVTFTLNNSNEKLNDNLIK